MAGQVAVKNALIKYTPGVLDHVKLSPVWQHINCMPTHSLTHSLSKHSEYLISAYLPPWTQIANNAIAWGFGFDSWLHVESVWEPTLNVGHEWERERIRRYPPFVSGEPLILFFSHSWEWCLFSALAWHWHYHYHSTRTDEFQDVLWTTFILLDQEKLIVP